MPPTDVVYGFLKTHKVGGTTIEQALGHTLLDVGVAPCGAQWDEHAASATTMRPRQRCAACLGHKDLPALAAWAHAQLLGNATTTTTRASALARAWGACEALRPTAAFRPPPPPNVRLATVLRDPVERAYAQYWFSRDDQWCVARATAHNATCAAFVLDFRDWVTLPERELAAHRIYRQQETRIHGETLALLGGGDLRVATRVLRALHVVGVTERMDDFMVLLAVGWGLPLPLLAKRYEWRNAHVTPRAPLSRADRNALLAASAPMRAERALHAEAGALQASALGRVPDLAAKRRVVATTAPAVTARVQQGHEPGHVEAFLHRLSFLSGIRSE